MRYPSLEVPRALANELMNNPGVRLPREPIPSRFSGNWQVDVTHVAEGYGEEAAEGS